MGISSVGCAATQFTPDQHTEDEKTVAPSRFHSSGLSVRLAPYHIIFFNPYTLLDWSKHSNKD